MLRKSYLPVLVVLFIARMCAEPIKLNPANPHYYLFNGRPTILITSAEHYALYHHHSAYKQPGSQSSYVIEPGRYVEDLLLHLPGGAYKADWIDPASGKVLSNETFIHQGGDRIFHAPEHVVDVALRIRPERQ